MTTITRSASTSPTTAEGCPCGEADGVRWCHSTLGRDTLRCTDCEHNWTILIDEPTPAPERELA